MIKLGEAPRDPYAALSFSQVKAYDRFCISCALDGDKGTSPDQHLPTSLKPCDTPGSRQLRHYPLPNEAKEWSSHFLLAANYVIMKKSVILADV